MKKIIYNSHQKPLTNRLFSGVLITITSLNKAILLHEKFVLNNQRKDIP